jgi:hypothetical protein
MRPQSAIAKGKVLEEFIVDRLRITGLDTRAYRQKGSGNGLNKGDIWSDLGICFEAKNTKNLALNSTLKQVRRESMGTQTPVIVYHPPQIPLEDSVVIIDWHYFESLLLKTQQPKTVNPDRALAWKVKSLIQSAKQLLKELE